MLNSNWWRRLQDVCSTSVDQPTRRKNKRRRDRSFYPNRRPRLEFLEDRRLLTAGATFTDAQPTLDVSITTGQNLAIFSTGTSYDLTLSSGTWTGTDTANVAGNGSATLVVTSAGLSALTTGINITDTGSTGGDGVTFNTSQASGYFNNFNIALSNASTASALAFNGATNFENSASLSAAVDGSVVINAGASLTSYAGSITLDATGTNAALTAGGEVISQSGAITLEATGNTTISSGITINAGSGPLTLAADVTASGAGDDGVGTLSINAGATVTTTGTITLRGADVNIDTSSNPAVVGASRALGTTASTIYSAGVSSPVALAVDASGDVYVANYANNTVQKFGPGSTTAIATYTAGVAGPQGLALDSSGNLYVANWGNNTVEKFAPGTTTASATYTAGVSGPGPLLVDAEGNLYVANANTVEKFAPGSTTASATYSFSASSPDALAVDSSGNLYVATGLNNTVEKFAPGSTTASAIYSLGLAFPTALATDSDGNLYVANIDDNTVERFASGSITPSAIYSLGLQAPSALAFDANGNLYVANNGNGTVEKFAPGSTAVSATYSVGGPEALAFGSSGNLYVASLNKNTVNVFSPTITTPTAASVVIQSSVESRQMLIGGSNSSPVAGINLTSAELAQIFTTSTGTVTVGDGQQTGNITFSAATPVTTSGAGLVVVQSAAGAGQVILDDGAGSGTALNGNGGSISITAGTGGITALSTSNSTAEISTTGSAVTLLTAGPIGTSSNRIQFADDSNTAQQVVSIGSATIQPASVYLDGLGSLTLDNVIAYAQNPTIDVTARTNLVVASGGTINAGSGSIALGADLTTAKTGDDGVGTLSINAGVAVMTTGTITLRGADVNIDTSSDPAVIGATRLLAAPPIAMYTSGVKSPEALAIGPNNNLYVVNSGGNTVEEFAPGSTTPSFTYSTGMNIPFDLAFDPSGNLYVSNINGNTVEEFAPGSNTPIATYSFGANNPAGLAFDSSGNLFVANGAVVSKFAPGSTTAEATYSTGLKLPRTLAFDSSGNLYVADVGNNAVVEFAPGSTTPIATYSASVEEPIDLVFDSSGNLYVANALNGTVERFTPGSTALKAIYSAGINGAFGLALDSSGNLYVADNGNSRVEEFAAGTTTPIAVYSTGLDGPWALAIDSSGNLYVDNYFSSTVAKFSPPVTTPTAAAVVIQSSVESRPMLIGGTNSSTVAGINLTSAELAQIFTTSTGTVTIGDSQQTGNITFSAATPATTAGAALRVLQSTTGAGQIILDEGASGGTALNGNGGTVTLSAGTGGIQAMLSSSGIALASAGFNANGSLNLVLGFAPTPGMQLTIVDNTAAATNAIHGAFSNLAQAGTFTADYQGTPYMFQVDYHNGGSLVLTALAPAADQLLDGNFSAAGVGAGNWQNAPGGSPWIFTGSAGVSGNGGAIAGGNPNAPLGTQVGFVQMTGSISQDVNFAAGNYTLDFLAAQRGNYSFGGQTLQVSVDGTPVGTVTPTGSSYALYAVAFNVTAGTHTITIAGTDPKGGDNTALLNDVSIQPAVTASQLADPDFGAVTIGAGNWEYTPSGSPWTFTGTAGISGNGGAIAGGNASAPQGSQVAFLQGTGAISQAVNLPAGSYTLEFVAAQRGNYNFGGQTLQVSVDGTVAGTITPTGANYTLYTVAFTVTAGTHSITIAGTDPLGGDNTALVNDVSIQPAVTASQLADPDFGAVSIGAGNWEYAPSGSPWTFIGSAGISGNGGAIAGGNAAAPQGTQVAFVQDTGSISQPVNLSAGSYTLEFVAAQRGNYNFGGQTLQVSVDGKIAGTVTPVGANYSLYAITFSATTGTHNITIAGTDPLGGDNTALVSNVSLQTNLPAQVADPDFGAVNIGAGNWQYAPSGSPWTFIGTAGVSGNGGAIAGGNGSVPEGSQVGFVQGTSSISQAVNLSAGTYSVEFVAAQRGNYNFGGQTLQVLLDGKAVGSLTPAGASYALYATPTFTATAGTHTITIAGTDLHGGDNTALVDDVSVQTITANQIADPDFGAVSVGAANWQYAPSSSPWTFIGSAGVSANGSAVTSGNPSPPVGTQVGFVQGTGSISQALSLSAGSYTLSFSAAQRGNYHQGGQTLQVLVDGTAVGSAITPASASYTGYTSISFTVSTGVHDITIQGLNPQGGDNTALIDQVMLNLA